MAISMLSVAVSNPRLLPPLPKCNKPTTSSSLSPLFLRSSSSLSTGDSGVEASSSCLGSISASRRQLIELGIGLLAWTMPAPDANATRIEYYATVGEQLCDLSFVRSGLGYCDVAVGNGVQPPRGELINVHYTARFADGRVFDSSYKRGRPLTMRIGMGKVLPGLDQGILGGGGVPPMLVGGKRKLLIPSKLAYGPEPAGCFSANMDGLMILGEERDWSDDTTALLKMMKARWWSESSMTSGTTWMLNCVCRTTA